MEDDMIVCNFPNCDEGGNHSFPPVFVDDLHCQCCWSPFVLDTVTDSKSHLALAKVCVEVDVDRIWQELCFHCKTFRHLDKAYPKQVNNDEDVGVRKKLDHTAGNLKKQGEAIWVPKKMLLSHPLRMRGQILEQPSRQPREAAKVVANIVQGLKAKKKTKAKKGRGVASRGGGRL
ncbi:hypothetical protein V6N13_043263 [Hibiscus sabdariffa]